MRYVMLLVLVISTLAGCGYLQQKNGVTSPQDNQNQQVRVKQTAPIPQKNVNSTQVADRLEQLAVSIPQVKSATCVVIGNTAVVGIDVAGDLERSRVGTIKYSVAEALRKDPYGANAIVTADMDIASRLREMRQDIRNGRPVAGFAEEMADIIGRIVPQLPQNIQPLNNPPARSEDRKKLNKDHL